MRTVGTYWGLMVAGLSVAVACASQSAPGDEISAPEPGDAGRVEGARGTPDAASAEAAVHPADASEDGSASLQAAASSRIAVGYSFACAVKASGGVACWGNSQMYQLGRAPGLGVESNVAGDVARVSGAVAVAADNFACALLASGRVMCWGPGFVGEPFPNAPPGVDLLAAYIPNLFDAVSVFVAGYRVCAIRKTGDVVCHYGSTSGVTYPGASAVQGWGSADFGVGNWILRSDGNIAFLGDATDGGTQGNLESSSDSAATGVAALGGSNGTGLCVVARAGGVQCRSTGSHTFAPLAGSSDVVRPGVGRPTQAFCAVRSSSGVRCWSANTTYADVAGLSNVAELADGVTSDCARLISGQTVCWGANHYGQLGDGTYTDSELPVEVKGL